MQVIVKTKKLSKKISIKLKFYTLKPCYTNFFEQGLKTASAIENHVMENRVKRGITVISSM